jgi:guanyl-specific ribonuclease Sa
VTPCPGGGAAPATPAAPAAPPALKTPAGLGAEETQAIKDQYALIEKGGPFNYPKKDGSEFKNKEGRLPAKPAGYYKEYTVDTPGASNRGARRIITGDGGEAYYTNDHYGTFDQMK